MQALIIVTGNETISPTIKVAYVERIRRRILCVLRSRDVSSAKIIVSAQYSSLAEDLSKDSRISERISIHLLDKTIYTIQDGLNSPFDLSQTELLVPGDVFASSVVDRIVESLATDDTKSCCCVDQKVRPVILGFKRGLLGKKSLKQILEGCEHLSLNTSEYAHVIENISDLKAAQKDLRKHMVKPGDGVVATFLNRPISKIITWQLLKLNARPNHLTVFTILLGLLACVLNVQANQLTIVLGAVAFHLSSVLDGCDGEIARLTFQETKFGKWFDNVGDCIVSTFYVASFGVAVWLHGGDIHLLYISIWGFLATWSSIVILYVALVRIQSGSLSDLLRMSLDGSNQAPIWIKPFILMLRREYFSLAIVVGVFANFQEGIVYAAAGLDTLFLALAILGTRRHMFTKKAEQ